MEDLCIKGGTVVNAGSSMKANVYVRDGVITAVTAPETVLEAKDRSLAGDSPE